MLRIILICLLFLPQVLAAQSFKSQQLLYPRVRKAMLEKDSLCRSFFMAKGIDNISKVFLRAFKTEGVIELWAEKNGTYVKIREYDICASSGAIGPKVRIGDGQVPEGFYKIDRFNPQSNFHLSLGLNYPNQVDRNRNSHNPGGDIFIHGDCVTIGCMPLTDEYIRELYWICVLAKNAGQKDIPVHVFPCKMNNSNMEKLKKAPGDNYAFWENLKEGYDYFETKKKLPSVTVNKGVYVFR